MENKYEQSFSLMPQVDLEYQVHLLRYYQFILNKPLKFINLNQDYVGIMFGLLLMEQKEVIVKKNGI